MRVAFFQDKDVDQVQPKNDDAEDESSMVTVACISGAFLCQLVLSWHVSISSLSVQSECKYDLISEIQTEEIKIV